MMNLCVHGIPKHLCRICSEEDDDDEKLYYCGKCEMVFRGMTEWMAHYEREHK